MEISLSWLKEYIPLEMDVAELSDALTMTGLEVDSVSDRFSYLDGIVLCRILTTSPHPNADRLKCCQVDTGEQVLDIVCGAPNAREGMLTACALPGTRLPDGLVIKKSVIRGESSEGMLCSALELGLSDEHSGIMDIAPDQIAAECTTGSPLTSALGLSDPVIEIDLTPNRPDCLSFIGVAREIGAFQENSSALNYPAVSLPEKAGIPEDIHHFTSVDIQAPALCPRYSARLIRGIKVAPSPFWLQDRLRSIGLKPINNIVDITNFVMMETGQPLHAFDFDHLAGHRIVVRTANEGEAFITLDHKPHQLSAEMLMICDGEKPVAIAGVMGGLNSEIETSTVDVLIESACFTPSSIRKTAKTTGIKTDASFRFERGVDPEGTLSALNRAAALMVEIAGGELIPGVVDENPVPYAKKEIRLSIEDTNRKLGTHFSADEIRRYLTAIEFTVETLDAGRILVIPPSFRVDVSRPEDLMEEIARLWGYNNIATTFPKLTMETPPPSMKLTVRNRIKILMAGLGFHETINYSFFHKSSCDRMTLESEDPGRRTIEILNPLSEEQAVMRTSLIPGLLETMKRNLAVQAQRLQIFELGRVFLKNGQEILPNELEMLAGLWAGFRHTPAWSNKTEDCDFYDLKGIVEALFHRLGLTRVRFARLDPARCSYTRPGYTAAIYVQEAPVGIIGEVHPQVIKNYELKQSAFIFEIDIDQLLQMIPERKCAKAIPKFPSTARDITLIIDKDSEAARITGYIKEDMDLPLIEDVHLLDVYEGTPIPPDKKSISFRITYRSTEETLQDKIVNDLHKNITEKLLSEFQASLHL